MKTGRLEAFSDGVIAVAITLLVLDLRVPAPGPHHPRLAGALGQQWPSYVAYVVSFATIGIIWINHHAVILRLREADWTILVVNLVLLMTIAILPFATSLMATYLTQSQGEHLAAAVYAGALLIMSLAFAAFNWQVLMRRPHLLHDHLAPTRRREILRRTVSGLVPYAAAVAIAPLSPYATLGICAVVAAYYASPASRPEA
ncbi:MAG TPA: TMEM175 family protein [Solirubrobacteraceae bacterium]|nr:TMEM175 family protein [Solirubrobacteraceae bacterium]